jgi:hypothetical protein
MSKEELKAKIKQLNNHINSLKAWDEYAQDCQIEYDRLIEELYNYDKTGETTQD